MRYAILIAVLTFNAYAHADVVLGTPSTLTYQQGVGANLIASWGVAAWSPFDLSPAIWLKADGSTVDASENNLTANWCGGTNYYTNGVNGQAFSFNGATCVTTAFNSVLATTNTTICFWGNCTGGAGTLRVAASMRQTSPSRGYYTGVSSGNQWLFSRAVSDVSFITAGGYAVEYNTWRHFSITCDSTAANFYVDGTLNGSSINVYVPATFSALMVGALTDGGPRLQFIGAIDDFMVFGRVLSTNDLNRIYNWRQ